MKNKKVAILYIALGRYTVFWDEFYESAEKHLLNADKHYFIWTDKPLALNYAPPHQTRKLPLLGQQNVDGHLIPCCAFKCF